MVVFKKKLKLNRHFILNERLTSNSKQTSSESSPLFSRMVKTIQIPSLCIPRVYHKFDEAYIEQVFCQLFGLVQGNKTCIERIDLVNRTDRNTSEPFYVAFLHFNASGVPRTTELETFVQRIEAGDEIKIEYSHPWFWKVRKNNAKRRGRVAGPRMLLCEQEVEEIKSHQKAFREQRQAKVAAEAEPTSTPTGESEANEGEEGV